MVWGICGVCTTAGQRGNGASAADGPPRGVLNRRTGSFRARPAIEDTNHYLGSVAGLPPFAS